MPKLSVTDIKMYVRWKLLLILGLVLWILLCATDLMSDDASKCQVEDIEPVIEENLPKIEEIDIFGVGYRILGKLLLWNFSACALSFLGSWGLRNCLVKLLHFYYNSNIRQHHERIMTALEPPASHCITAKLSSSKIPVLVQEPQKKSSSELDTDTPPIDRDFEKKCTQLRQEMAALRATSLKEHATLSRKLEALAREKRELSKRLTLSNKENRAAKHQMEELLAEKNMLLSRLENANKEFKLNTKTKKVALGKLEEAQVKIERLEQKLEQVTRDKEIMERKFKIIEAEYAMLKKKEEQYKIRFYLDDCVQTEEELIYERLSEELEGEEAKETDELEEVDNNEKEHVIDKSSVNLQMQDVKDDQTDDGSLSQAEIDMHNIQQKIMNLERNLEKFSTRRITPRIFTSSDMLNYELPLNTVPIQEDTSSDLDDERAEDISQEYMDDELRRLEEGFEDMDENAYFDGSSEDFPLETLKEPDMMNNFSSTEDLYFYSNSEDPSSAGELINSKPRHAMENMHTLAEYMKPITPSTEKSGSNCSFTTTPSDEKTQALSAFPHNFVTTSPAFQNFLKSLAPKSKTTGIVY